MIAKEFKIVLAESNTKDSKCYDCIFYYNSACCEPYGIDCFDDAPNENYYWKLEIAYKELSNDI